MVIFKDLLNFTNTSNLIAVEKEFHTFNIHNQYPQIAHDYKKKISNTFFIEPNSFP